MIKKLRKQNIKDYPYYNIEYLQKKGTVNIRLIGGMLNAFFQRLAETIMTSVNHCCSIFYQRSWPVQ